MEDVLKILYDAIINSNIETLRTVLPSLKVDDVSTSESYILLSNLLRISMTYNTKVSLIFLYNYWSEVYYSSDDGITLYSVLFTRKEFDLELLLYINEVLDEQSADESYMHMLKDKNFSLVEIVESLNILGKDIQVYEVIPASVFKWACDKAIKVFGVPKLDNLQYFYDLTKNENGAIADYFAYLLRQVGNFAEIPDWVYNPLDGMLVRISNLTLPLESEIAIPEYQPDKSIVLSVKNLVDIVLSNSDIVLYDKTTGEEVKPSENEESIMKDSIISRLTDLESAGSLRMMQEYGYIKQLESLQDNEELFRLLGPVSPVAAASVEDMQYGGERMFISNRFLYDDGTDGPEGTEGIITSSWFVGYCEYCNLRLRRKYHAVRQPLIDGGWIGCFCSWRCVKDKVSKVDFTDEITPQLCDKHEESLLNLGVYDRVPDKDYITYLADFYKSKEISGNTSVLYFYKTGVDCPPCEEFESEKNKLYPYIDPSRIIPVDLAVEVAEQITEIPSFAIYKGDKMVNLVKGYDLDNFLEILKAFNY